MMSYINHTVNKLIYDVKCIKIHGDYADLPINNDIITAYLLFSIHYSLNDSTIIIVTIIIDRR